MHNVTALFSSTLFQDFQFFYLNDLDQNLLVWVQHSSKCSSSNEARFKDLVQSNEASVIEALSNFLKETSDTRRNHQEQ